MLLGLGQVARRLESVMAIGSVHFGECEQSYPDKARSLFRSTTISTPPALCPKYEIFPVREHYMYVCLRIYIYIHIKNIHVCTDVTVHICTPTSVCIYRDRSILGGLDAEYLISV